MDILKLHERYEYAEHLLDTHWPGFGVKLEQPSRGYVINIIAVAMQHEQERILSELEI